MTVTETMNLIRIGLDKPKHYKRSVWNQAKRVMDYLSENSDGEIYPFNKGEGNGQFATVSRLSDENLRRWAIKYLKSLRYNNF